MSARNFLVNAVKHPMRTGSLLPSQSFLIKKMLKPIEAKYAQCIIELGAGEGCITKYILQKANKNTHVISFEINKSFVPEIAKRAKKAKNFVLVNDDALHLEKYLVTHSIKHIDYVISSLPLAHLPKNKVEALLIVVKKYLKKDGYFIQYQYSLQSFKRIKAVFSQVKIKFTLLNLPPAFIYVCRR